MSEIKGQLLGIILVLILFGTAATVLIAAFSKMTKAVDSNVNNIVSSMENIKTDSQLLHY